VGTPLIPSGLSSTGVPDKRENVMLESMFPAVNRVRLLVKVDKTW
jgi:hypothetical protein